MKSITGSGLFSKIVIWFLATVSVALLVLAGQMTHLQRKSERERLNVMREVIDEQGRFLANLLETLPASRTRDLESLHVVPLFLFEATGTLRFAPRRLSLFPSREPVPRDRRDLERDLADLRPLAPLNPEANTVFPLPEGNFLAHRFSVPEGGTFVAFLRVREHSSWDIRQLLMDDSLRWWALLLFVVIGLLCFALARSLVQPILQFQGLSRTIAGGDFQARLPPELTRRFDELGALANDFNSMATTIERTIREQQQLLWDISHELRTPLTRLGLTLELLRQAPPDRRDELQTRLARNVKRLNGLIQQILDYSRLGKVPEPSEPAGPIPLNRLLTDLLVDLREEPEAEGREVMATLPTGDVMVEGFEEQLHRAIGNVLENAIRHTPAGTRISVHLSTLHDRTQAEAIIEIRDWGKGITIGNLPHLFLPFFRGQEQSGPTAPGLGLGLAIVQRTIEAHHGKVRAWNAEGGGLAVEIRLPCHPSALPLAASGEPIH